MQIIYQIIASYFEDDCADELTNAPVLTAILEKEGLASQPAILRFFNRMDEDTLKQLDQSAESKTSGRRPVLQQRCRSIHDPTFAGIPEQLSIASIIFTRGQRLCVPKSL